MEVVKLPSFLDFEASSLTSDSYPIEVAWSLADGSVESHLISPAGIDTWEDWSLISQQVHGITREELLGHGKTPAWVCARMNEQLAGQAVYTDNPAYDRMWLGKLFSVVKGSSLRFRLGFVDELLFGLTYPNPARRAAAMIEIREMKEEARRRVGGQHRAHLDVQYLIELWRIATGNESIAK
jgi:hypothetical protein